MGNSDPIGEADVVKTMRGANRREDFGGRRAFQYTHWIKEQMSWKETCYLGDWTFLANLKLEGPDAERLLKDLSINSFENYAVGGGKHLVQCDDDGYIVAEGVLVKDDEDSFIVHGVPAYWTAFNLEQGDYDATAEYRDTFNFQVQGPNAMKVFDDLTEHSLRDVDFMRSGFLDIAGHEVRAVRFGMSGEIGFELHGPADAGPDIWEAIREAGKPHGLRRLSVKTSSINQLEAGIASRVRDFISAIFGPDMKDYREYLRETATRDLITHALEGSFTSDDIRDWYRNPVELGWGRYMQFDHEFKGREALEEIAENPEREFVTLEWDSDDVVDVYASLYENGDHYNHHKFMDMPHQQKRAMVADRVLAGGEDVGVATMRGYSYFFKEMLSLCVIDTDYAEPGTEVTVLWGEGKDPESPTVEDHVQKEIRATVAQAPYKPDRRREKLE